MQDGLYFSMIFAPEKRICTKVGRWHREDVAIQSVAISEYHREELLDEFAMHERAQQSIYHQGLWVGQCMKSTWISQ
jgi:hypothetical protein